MNRVQGVVKIAFGTVKEKVLLVPACFLNRGSEVFRISKELELRIESGDKNNRSDGDANGEAKNQKESEDNAKSNRKTGSSRKGPVLIDSIVGHVFMRNPIMIHLRCLGSENGSQPSDLESVNIRLLSRVEMPVKRLVARTKGGFDRSCFPSMGCLRFFAFRVFPLGG